ncbi:hypothetical protein [Pseudotamlana carrageenivorans]|uniref:hypothetical protein n=1 Tax=Pseudotamlana carrageenivorans TaxID=2069432 RepID=UPI00268D8642
MIINLITGKRDYMQPPSEMTEELRSMSNHPSVQQMLKYTFIGSKATVKNKVKAFIEETQIDELIAVSHIYDHQDRIKSYVFFAEIMKELNIIA